MRFIESWDKVCLALFLLRARARTLLLGSLTPGNTSPSIGFGHLQPSQRTTPLCVSLARQTPKSAMMPVTLSENLANTRLGSSQIHPATSRFDSLETMTRKCLADVRHPQGSRSFGCDQAVEKKCLATKTYVKPRCPLSDSSSSLCRQPAHRHIYQNGIQRRRFDNTF